MTTVRKLVYLLWRHLEGGNVPDDTRYTYRQLREHVRSGVAEAVKAAYYEQLNLQEFRYGEDSVVVTFDLPIIHDDSKYGKLPYATLPVKTIPLPGGRGVTVGERNRVSSWATQYVPVRQEEVFVGRLQPPVPCVVQFYRAGDDFIFFNGKVDARELTFTVKYALPGEDDDQEINLPEDFVNRLVSIAAQICNGQIRPTDTVNDGAPLNVR